MEIEIILTKEDIGECSWNELIPCKINKNNLELLVWVRKLDLGLVEEFKKGNKK